MANTIRIKRGTKAQIEASELAHGEPAISTDYDQVYVGTASSKVRLALSSEIPTLNADQIRKITVSTSDPSGGSDGDLWFKYS